jgi:hypothetical protein
MHRRLRILNAALCPCRGIRRPVGSVPPQMAVGKAAITENRLARAGLWGAQNRRPPASWLTMVAVVRATDQFALWRTPLTSRSRYF